MVHGLSQEGFRAKIAFLYESALNIMAVITGIMVAIMMFAISFSVAFRFLFNIPSAWVVEITTYLLLYCTFLGAPWLLKHGGHVNVDLLINMVSPVKQVILSIVTLSIGFVIGLVLFKYGFEVTVDHFQRQVVVMNVLATPKYLLLGVIPFGSFFLTIEFARQIVVAVKKLKGLIN